MSVDRICKEGGGGVAGCSHCCDRDSLELDRRRRRRHLPLFWWCVCVEICHSAGGVFPFNFLRQRRSRVHDHRIDLVAKLVGSTLVVVVSHNMCIFSLTHSRCFLYDFISLVHLYYTDISPTTDWLPLGEFILFNYQSLVPTKRIPHSIFSRWSSRDEIMNVYQSNLHIIYNNREYPSVGRRSSRSSPSPQGILCKALSGRKEGIQCMHRSHQQVRRGGL